ncbi:MAG TPA: lipase family protein [Acidimicrobiales bacterium]
MRLRKLSRAGAALGVVVALASMSTACAPPPEFYDPPPVLSGQPGDVIRSTPTNFSTNGAVTSTALMYRSTTATGQPNAVTGTLLVPTAAWTGAGSRPIVSYAVGTQGLSDNCASSKSMTTGTNYEQGNIQALLDRGWAVAVTDYEKLGPPGDHTYVIKDAEGHAVLDIVRAAQRLPGSGIAANAPVGIWGYSQGGQAAAAAAELEATYAPELNVRGVVAGGVPSDLGALAAYLNGPGNLFFSFLAFAAVGLNSAYPELNLESYLNEQGASLLETGRNACLVDGLLLGAGQNITNLTTSNPLENPQWQARIAEQRLGTVAPQVPVFLYHGSVDEIIPVTQGQALRAAWCGRGARVQYGEYFLSEHLGGIFFGLNDGITFMTARFAGQPFTSNC